LNAVRQNDYYQLLGLSCEADQAEIKAAFRKRARACHPDRNPQDPQAADRFGALSAAYRVLSDPALRSRYDKRLAAQDREPYHAPSSTSTSFFERLAKRAQGSDLRFTLELDLADVVRGGAYRLDLPRQRICPSCGGVESAGCGTCRGGGIVIRVEALSLTLPAGVEDGARYILRGEGDAGSSGGSAGDLFVDIRYRKHPLLRVEGHDLVCRATLPFPRAALGCKLIVPTLGGMKTVDVLPGTQTGSQIKLPGLGLPRLKDGRRGDIRVLITLETPVGLDDESIAALKALEHRAGDKAFPKSRSFRGLCSTIANQVPYKTRHH